MPNLNAWPLDTDVRAILESARAWDASAGIDLAALVVEAADEFENETGYKPFLNTSNTPTTRAFNAPGPIRTPHGTLVGGGRKLFLGAGLLSIASLSIDGVLQTAGIQYFDGRFQHDGAITMIAFPGPVFSKPQGISISAVWGYCAVLPLMAFNAVKARAAFKALKPLAERRRVTAEGEQGPIKAKETGPVRTEYAVSSADKLTDFAAMGTQLDDDWRRGVNRFRLVD